MITRWSDSNLCYDCVTGERRRLLSAAVPSVFSFKPTDDAKQCFSFTRY